MTPARRVADRLAGLLTHQTVMASPGPRMRNPGPEASDTENTSDSDNPPVIRPGRGAGRIPVPTFDSNEDLPPSPTTTSQQPAGGAAGPRQRRRAAAVPAGTTDAEGYTWTAAEYLLQNDKSADCKYFYGHHQLDGSFKCRLCP